MKIAHVELYTTSNIVYNFEFSTCNQHCRIILDNNNSVKFTGSRGDNSTTNDSMVMKIALAELYTSSNIVCNFKFSTCNTVGEKLQTTIIH